MTKRRGKYTDVEEAEAAAEHEREYADGPLPENVSARPTKGDPVDDQIVYACGEARRIAALCELLGFPVAHRGVSDLVALLDGGRRQGRTLAQLIEDPNDRPYFWDQPEGGC